MFSFITAPCREAAWWAGFQLARVTFISKPNFNYSKEDLFSFDRMGARRYPRRAPPGFDGE